MDSAYLSSPLIYAEGSSTGTSYFNTRNHPSRFGQSNHFLPSDDAGESSGSEVFPGLRRSKQTESPLQSFATELTTDLRSHSNSNSGVGTPPTEQKVVGTPDYLAPETILGLRGDDAAVDWVCVQQPVFYICILMQLSIAVGAGCDHLRIFVWYPTLPR